MTSLDFLFCPRSIALIGASHTEEKLGGVVDEQFGPVVMFGLGGIFVELFKDVAFALAPITHEDALCLV